MFVLDTNNVLVSIISEKQLCAGAPETQRAIRQMEVQLRATRQDALQLATAVVRLEKEKAALQSQASLLQTRVRLSLTSYQWHL